MRVLIVEDEPYMAEAIRDGLRLKAIAADIAADGDTALELLSVTGYDMAVLDRDIPGPSGDEIAKSVVASGSGMPILMLTISYAGFLMIAGTLLLAVVWLFLLRYVPDGTITTLGGFVPNRSDLL